MTWTLQIKYKLKRWRGGGVASLLKDSCRIINYRGRNRKCCWNSPGSATQDVAHLIGLTQQQSFWGLKKKKALLIFRKTLWENGTQHCCIFIYPLNSSGHCYKPRTQVSSPKADSLPALLLPGLLAPLQDQLCCPDGCCCRKWAYCAFAILFKHCRFGTYIIITNLYTLLFTCLKRTTSPHGQLQVVCVLLAVVRKNPI